MSRLERSVDLLLRGRRSAAVLHDAGDDGLVIFSHGFRGDRTGPNRTFVRTARRLADRGISSLRFDQFGSGDSDGEFVESRFDDWVEAIVELADERRSAGRRVGLLGQSMGASAAICAAALTDVTSVVAWVPDPELEPSTHDGSGVMEEGGQRVADVFWDQAHAADIIGSVRRSTAPVHLVLATADEFVSSADREALIGAARAGDRVDVLDGWPHSAWSSAQADHVIDLSVAFLESHLR